MKTNNNISYSRGRTSTSGFNQIKKVVKVLAILIGSTIGLVLWVLSHEERQCEITVV